MRIRRRSLRKGLVLVGCVVGAPSFPAWMLGLVGLTLGSLLHLWTKGVLEQNERLVTGGPYRWTRNPFYLANALIDGGLCLVIGRGWLALPFALIWLWSYRETILREERRLRELFGAELDRYLLEVPRLLPSLRPLPAERANGQFRWSNPNLSRGREYARLLGVWLAPGAIWAAACLRREGLEIFDASHALELGAILLLIVGWLLKLALAETLRRPETSLQPLEWSPRTRSGVAMALSIPMLVAGGIGRSGSGGGWTIALLALLAAGVLSDRDLRTRRITESLSVIAVVGYGLASQSLWLACLPLAWLGLSLLDGVGQARLARDGGTKGPTWPLLPRISIASAAGISILAGLRLLLR